MKVKITEANGVEHVFDTPNLSIGIEGYGDKTSPDGLGTPIFIEEHKGLSCIHVWADINQEDPTHQIDLSGAKESERKEE